MSLDYWFMLPISIVIATVAMASGVEGATFFSPLFILALRLPPEVAIGTALITEVFGFASGLFAYFRKRLIDYHLGLALLVVTIPLAIVGTLASGVIPAVYLKVILGVGLFVVALSFLRQPKHEEVLRLDAAVQAGYGGPRAETCLVAADGEEIRYTVCDRTEGRIMAGIGALFMGMVSTGLGEMNGYFLLQRCRVPSKVSVATSVFVVAVTALIASAGHFVQFAVAGGDVLTTVLSICIFTVPGVIIGGQIGSRVASRIPQRTLETGLALLFMLVAALTLGQGITDQAIGRALRWTASHAAELGIRVVNLSVGADSPVTRWGSAIDAAVRELVMQGVTVVAAAGNGGIRRLTPPASAPEALTVGGLDDHNTFSHEEIELWHSNYGVTATGATKPEVVAPSIWVAAPVLPGSHVEEEALQLFAQRHRGPEPSAIEARIAALKLITPYYQHVDGTSFAAPITAGVIACILEANPDLTPDAVRQILLTTAQLVSGATRERQGAGAVAAGQAVAEALSVRYRAPAAVATLPQVGPQLVRFQLHDHHADRVELFGSWNDWSTPNVVQQAAPGVWRAELSLATPGHYAYKYRIDGRRWLDDPANPRKAWDGTDGFNSLLSLD